jgi:hypothetical protein
MNVHRELCGDARKRVRIENRALTRRGRGAYSSKPLSKPKHSVILSQLHLNEEEKGKKESERRQGEVNLLLSPLLHPFLLFSRKGDQVETAQDFIATPNHTMGLQQP